MKEASFSGDRIELLQTFVRIVESGNLSAAAQRMDTTQPTVSRRLQALERLFGVRLMRRSTHALTLTPDGQRCYALSQALLGEWQALDEELRGAEAAPTGTLRVLVPHALGQEQLVAPLARYLETFPEVDVEWLLQDRRPDFAAEGIDCAIQVGTVDDPGLVAIPLFDLPRIVVGAPSLVAGRDLPADASQLQDWPWLALHTFYRDRVEMRRIADGAGAVFPIRPRLRTDSLYALRHAALAGLGVGIVSAWLVQGDLAAGRLVHLVPQWQALPLPVHLVYPYIRHPPARLRRFIEVVKAAGLGAPPG